LAGAGLKVGWDVETCHAGGFGGAGVPSFESVRRSSVKPPAAAGWLRGGSAKPVGKVGSGTGLRTGAAGIGLAAISRPADEGAGELKKAVNAPAFGCAAGDGAGGAKAGAGGICGSG
jgi:hypothetical protein